MTPVAPVTPTNPSAMPTIAATICLNQWTHTGKSSYVSWPRPHHSSRREHHHAMNAKRRARYKALRNGNKGMHAHSYTAVHPIRTYICRNRVFIAIYNTCSSGRLGVGLACQFFRASAPRCERSSGLRWRVILPYNQRTLALSDLFLSSRVRRR